MGEVEFFGYAVIFPLIDTTIWRQTILTRELFLSHSFSGVDEFITLNNNVSIFVFIFFSLSASIEKNKFYNLTSPFQVHSPCWRQQTNQQPITRHIRAPSNQSGSGPGHVLYSRTYSAKVWRRDLKSRNMSLNLIVDNWRPCWVLLTLR